MRQKMKKHVLAENYKRFFKESLIKEAEGTTYSYYSVPISGNPDYPQGGIFGKIKASDMQDAILKYYADMEDMEWDEFVEDGLVADFEEYVDDWNVDSDVATYDADDMEFIYIKKGNARKGDAYEAALRAFPDPEDDWDDEW
jgi:hypothetical protein